VSHNYKPLPLRVGSAQDILQHVMLNEGAKGTLFIQGLNEYESFSVSQRVIYGGWQETLKRIESLNYSEIHQSRGDIRRLSFYPVLRKTLTVITGSVYSEIIRQESVRTCTKAFMNLEAHRADFQDGYRRNDILVKSFYANLVVALVKFKAALIAYSAARSSGISGGPFVDPRSIESHYRDSLEKFNLYCQNGKMRSFFNAVTGDGGVKGLTGIEVGAAAATAVALGGLAVASVGIVVWLIREIVFQYFRSRVSISEDLKGLADYVQSNAATIRANNPGAAAKQDSMSSSLRDWADKVALDQKLSAKAASSDLSSSDASSAKVQVQEPVDTTLSGGLL
jgi:hypothetical protein